MTARAAACTMRVFNMLRLNLKAENLGIDVSCFRCFDDDCSGYESMVVDC